MPASPDTPRNRVVSGYWLEAHLDDPSVVVVEVTSKPDDTTYRAGHIPGARWRFWKDFCWHPTDRDLVTPEAAAERLGALGVTPETTLVFYGDPVQYGTYAAWAYTMAGHPDIRVLDGTRTRWIADGRPMTTDIPDVAPTDYAPQPADRSTRLGRDDVRAGLGKPGRVLLDTRSPEEYRGELVAPPHEMNHGAERTGRIPGAIHLYYQELLNDDDTYKSPDELKAIFAASGLSPDGGDEIVGYCRLTHRATFTWFAMRDILGFDNVKLYDGSWTEWGSIVGFPVEK